MKLRHFALIPAKEKSSRFRNKNWRNFLKGASLVDFVLKSIPSDLFTAVIVSTDKKDFFVHQQIEKHQRSRNLCRKYSCIKETMQLIIKEYNMQSSDYLWLMNPTSPFRAAEDFYAITKIVNTKKPNAVVSVVKLTPYIWKDNMPLFKTFGRRRNTDDFREKYAVENGMFYVVNVGYFQKTNFWYGKRVVLYRQKSPFSSIDIDTEEDFRQAQKIGKLWKIKPER